MRIEYLVQDDIISLQGQTNQYKKISNPNQHNHNERKASNMLFEKEIKEADEKLHRKGYYISNMEEPYNDLYEVYDKNSNVVIDYLSVTQLIQLSNMIK